MCRILRDHISHDLSLRKLRVVTMGLLRGCISQAAPRVALVVSWCIVWCCVVANLIIPHLIVCTPSCTCEPLQQRARLLNRLTSVHQKWRRSVVNARLVKRRGAR
jgi:hypothetical protein